MGSFSDCHSETPQCLGETYQWICRLQGAAEWHLGLLQQYYQIVLSGPSCGIPPAVIKPHDQKLILAYSYRGLESSVLLKHESKWQTHSGISKKVRIHKYKPKHKAERERERELEAG